MDLDGKLDGDLCDEHPSHRKKPNLDTAARPDLIGSVPDTSPIDALYRSRADPDAGFLACSGAVRCRPARGVADGTVWSGRGRGCGGCTVCWAARLSVKRTRRLPADRQLTTVQHNVTGKTTCAKQNSALEGSSKLLTRTPTSRPTKNASPGRVPSASPKRAPAYKYRQKQSKQDMYVPNSTYPNKRHAHNSMCTSKHREESDSRHEQTRTG